jgi:hypothetical protein
LQTRDNLVPGQPSQPRTGAGPTTKTDQAKPISPLFSTSLVEKRTQSGKAGTGKVGGKVGTGSKYFLNNQSNRSCAWQASPSCEGA